MSSRSETVWANDSAKDVVIYIADRKFIVPARSSRAIPSEHDTAVQSEPLRRIGVQACHR